MRNIGRELASARTRAGLTQADLARRLGVTQARLSQIENGTNARIDTLQSYARALGLELLLVPQQQLRRVQSMLRGDESTVRDEERSSRFPTLADLVPQDDEIQRDRRRRFKASER